MFNSVTFSYYQYVAVMDRPINYFKLEKDCLDYNLLTKKTKEGVKINKEMLETNKASFKQEFSPF